MKVIKAKQRKRDKRALKSFLVDSGATSHYVRPTDELPVVGPSNKHVHLPNGQIVQSEAQVKLPFQLKHQARIAELVPGIKQNSLLSVGKLSDAGYTTVFLPHNDGVHVIDGDKAKTVLQGWREEAGSRLWRINEDDDGDDDGSAQDVPEKIMCMVGGGDYEETSVPMNEIAGNV